MHIRIQMCVYGKKDLCEVISQIQSDLNTYIGMNLDAYVSVI